MEKPSREQQSALKKYVTQEESKAMAAQSNDLVRYACYELSVSQLRVWLACLRQIPIDAKELPVIQFSVNDLATMCGLDPSAGSVRWQLYDAIEEMRRMNATMIYRNPDGSRGMTDVPPFFAQVYWDEKPQNHTGDINGENLKEKVFYFGGDGPDSPIASAAAAKKGYRKRGDTLTDKKYVSIVFSPVMKAELLNLTQKGRYTQLSIFYLLPMVSKYSMRIYQYLHSYLYKATTEGRSGTYTVYLSLSRIRQTFSDKNKVSSTLSTWQSLKSNVLCKAIQEINAHTDIQVNPKDPLFKDNTKRKPTKQEMEDFPEMMEDEWGEPLSTPPNVVGHMVKVGKSVVGVLLEISECSLETKKKHLEAAIGAGSPHHDEAVALAEATLVMGHEGTKEVVEAQFREVPPAQEPEVLTEEGTIPYASGQKYERMAQSIAAAIDLEHIEEGLTPSQKDALTGIIRGLVQLGCRRGKSDVIVDGGNKNMIAWMNQIIRSEGGLTEWLRRKAVEYDYATFWNGKNVKRPEAYLMRCLEKDLGNLTLEQAVQKGKAGKKTKKPAYSASLEAAFNPEGGWAAAFDE